LRTRSASPPLDEKKAQAYSLRLLAKRAYSSGQLAEKLRLKGAPEPVVELILEKMERLSFLNDEDFIRRFAEAKKDRGYGARWIEAALQKKLLPRALVRKVLDEESESSGDSGSLEGAQKALGPSGHSRLRPKKGEDPRKHAARLFAFLARRGFSSAIASAAVRRALTVDLTE